MEYVLDGKIVTGRMVEVAGIKYPRQAFADVAGMIPVKETPTLEDGQTFEWNAGSVINGEWVRFIVRNKNADELAQDVLSKRASEYPAIGDQLDALFHAGAFPAEMTAQIQAVKDNNPKGV